MPEGATADVLQDQVGASAFELAGGELTLEEALSLEAELRAHPGSAPLNRAWLAVARRPMTDSAPHTSPD